MTAHVPKGIAAREAAARRAFRELETDARLFIADRIERGTALRALDNVRRAIQRHAAERHREYDRLPHRPSEREFGRDVEAAAERHHSTLPAAVDIILTRIAPTMPEPYRSALLGPWRTIEDQRKHLIDRLRPRSKPRTKAPA